MREWGKTFLSGMVAGLLIGMGGAAFLAMENRVVGSVLFVVGLFTILSFGFQLFTGKVCYAGERGWRYVPELAVVWLGNFAGTFISGLLLRQTRMIAVAGPRAAELCAAKLNDGLLSLFILGIFCGAMMYAAVECYRLIDNPVGKYIAPFLCIAVFIIGGFEHCIANMYYFTVAFVWTQPQAFLVLLTVTAGNAVGGIALHGARLKLGKAA